MTQSFCMGSIPFATASRTAIAASMIPGRTENWRVHLDKVLVLGSGTLRTFLAYEYALREQHRSPRALATSLPVHFTRRPVVNWRICSSDSIPPATSRSRIEAFFLRTATVLLSLARSFRHFIPLFLSDAFSLFTSLCSSLTSWIGSRTWTFAAELTPPLQWEMTEWEWLLTPWFCFALKKKNE